VRWQGEGAAFDRARPFRAAPGGTLPDRRQPHAAWSALWGSCGDRHPVVDVALARPFDVDRWPLERLVYTRPASDKRPPAGADLDKLGLLPSKKLPKKPP